jgi:hypothetical protein
VHAALVLSFCSFSQAQSRGDELIQELPELPPLPGVGPSNGKIPPIELRRSELYREIRQLGAYALPALERGLRDDDVRLRQNVATVFNALAGGWIEELRPKLNIRRSLSALIEALEDSDTNVRAWSAQAIGGIGPDAADAVPALIRLLKNDTDGGRNSACIALKGIGPAAKEALPTLRNALSDPSVDVRRFAKQAIDAIQK